MKHAPTPEGEYSDTRHVTQLKVLMIRDRTIVNVVSSWILSTRISCMMLCKVLLEQFLASELPMEKFPAMGPAVASSSKGEAKSVRKFGANSRSVVLLLVSQPQLLCLVRAMGTLTYAVVLPKN